MKTSVLFNEDGAQVVLTPETKLEEDLLKRIKGDNIRATVKSGQFYQCRGGYVTNGLEDKDSLIVTFDDFPESVADDRHISP